MSEMSTALENEPPPAAPVIATRAKVVRESFTVLRSDFEINEAPAVPRPQKPSVAPVARGGGQNNVLMPIGGGVVLLGGILAFLFVGNSSGVKGKPMPAGPSATTLVTSAVTSAAKPVAASVVVTPHDLPGPPPTPAHSANPPAAEPSHSAIPMTPKHPALPVAHKNPSPGAADTVRIRQPRELGELAHAQRDAPHDRRAEQREKPTVSKPVKTVRAALPPPPVEHHSASHERPQPVAHHQSQSSGAELDPLHPFGN